MPHFLFSCLASCFVYGLFSRSFLPHWFFYSTPYFLFNILLRIWKRSFQSLKRQPVSFLLFFIISAPPKRSRQDAEEIVESTEGTLQDDEELALKLLADWRTITCTRYAGNKLCWDLKYWKKLRNYNVASTNLSHCKSFYSSFLS